MGANEANGISIGFSPAGTEKEHVKVYRLPMDMFDVIVYTGFGYAGRNLLLTRASDAVITICGRMGTLNEFTVAFEDKKPLGVLEGSGGTADKIDYLLKGDFSNSVNAGESIEFEKRQVYQLFIHHRDIPGAFAKIDRVLSDYGINIRENPSRQLGNGSYVVTVYLVHQEIKPEVIEALTKLELVHSVKV